MLHFPVSLMNRLNKTESGIFVPCMISLLLKDLRIYHMYVVIPELIKLCYISVYYMTSLLYSG